MNMGMPDAIDDFLNQQNFAIVGVSRKRNKFGNMLYRHLRSRGYHVYPVNPTLQELEGDRCFGTLKSIPEKVDVVFVVLKPENTKEVVSECAELGIKRVFFQQGAESHEILELCKENEITAIYKTCAILHFQPSSFHRAHRWINHIFKIRPAVVD